MKTSFFCNFFEILEFSLIIYQEFSPRAQPWFHTIKYDKIWRNSSKISCNSQLLRIQIQLEPKLFAVSGFIYSWSDELQFSVTKIA